MNRFIVFEGLDGAGKSTQIEMLLNYFDGNAITYKFLHFPRTKGTLIGEMIAKFLRGEFGGFDEIGPQFVALMYSCDRLNIRQQLLDYMKTYQFLVVDRYVYSNIAFQCAKLESESEKDELRDWILKLEYGENSLPKPDLTLYLKAPFTFIAENLTGRRSGQDREYLKGASDIHESDMLFQEKVEREYLKLQDIDPDFKIVNCEDSRNMILSPAAVNDKIVQYASALV